MVLLKKHPHMTLMLWIIISSIVACFAAMLILGAGVRGYTIGNLAFALSMVALIALSKVPERPTAKAFAIILLTLVFIAIVGLGALLLAETFPALARLLFCPIATLGIYPRGSDAWYPASAIIWIASSFCLIVVSSLAGMAAATFSRSNNKES